MAESTPQPAVSRPERSQVAPFRLLDDEPLERPDRPVRLTFEHFAAGTLHLAGLARSVVPIELAQPGDEQAALCSRWGEEPKPASLDPYIREPDLVSVIADRPITVDRPQPQVRELFLAGPSGLIDAESLRRLPGLESLVLGEWTGTGPLVDLDVLPGLTSLRQLRIGDLVLPSLAPLGGCTGLESLIVTSYVQDRQADLVVRLDKLRWLSLKGPLRGLHKLGALSGLERVELEGVTLTNLKPFRGWSRLRSLTLAGSIRSLKGVEAFTLLEELGCYGMRLPDLAPLAALRSLRRLELNTGETSKDLRPLTSLVTLRVLDISLGSITTHGSIPSLDFLAGMQELEEFWGRNGRVADRRLDALAGLPQLKRAFVVGDLAEPARALRARRPDLRLKVVVPVQAPDLVLHAVGDLEIREETSVGLWSIFQDVTGLVGGESNFDADRRIRRAIRAHAPELLRRLEFDPDADFVSITAQSEVDIRLAADIILSLRVSRPDSR